MRIESGGALSLISITIEGAPPEEIPYLQIPFKLNYFRSLVYCYKNFVIIMLALCLCLTLL